MLILPVQAQKNSKAGFLDFNVYPYPTDVENDSVFTLNTFSKLPNRFSYFSLLNLINQIKIHLFSMRVGPWAINNARYFDTFKTHNFIFVKYQMFMYLSKPCKTIETIFSQNTSQV